MPSWLLIAAASHAAVANIGSELKGVAPVVAPRSSDHSIDFKVGGGAKGQGLMFRQIDLDQQVAPGAQVGIGMAGSSAKAMDNIDTGGTGGRRGSQGPAINFVLKF